MASDLLIRDLISFRHYDRIINRPSYKHAVLDGDATTALLDVERAVKRAGIYNLVIGINDQVPWCSAGVGREGGSTTSPATVGRSASTAITLGENHAPDGSPKVCRRPRILRYSPSRHAVGRRHAHCFRPGTQGSQGRPFQDVRGSLCQEGSRRLMSAAAR
jgi:hypothetical protein